MMIYRVGQLYRLPDYQRWKTNSTKRVMESMVLLLVVIIYSMIQRSSVSWDLTKWDRDKESEYILQCWLFITTLEVQMVDTVGYNLICTIRSWFTLQPTRSRSIFLSTINLFCIPLESCFALFPLSLSFTIFYTFFLSLSLSLSLLLSIFLTLSLSLLLSIFLTHSFSLSLSLSLSHTLSIFLTLSCTLSFPIFPSLSVSNSLWHTHRHLFLL